jgi:hypothetical protein
VVIEMRLPARWTRSRQLLAAVALLATFACKPQERPEPTISCAEYDEYYTDPLDIGYWFGFGDDTPRAYDGTEDGNVSLDDNDEPIRPPAPLRGEPLDEEICGLTTADFYKTYGHNDWGSAWGSQLRGRADPYDGGDFQGISFWARSASWADKSFTLVVETAQTAKPSEVENEDQENPLDCREPTINEGAAVYRTLADGTQQISSEVAEPEDCGNSFRKLVTITDRWEFYRVPFEDFWQEALPNRKPDGMDNASIYQLGIRADKEKWLEFWIAGLSFYRELGWQPEDGAPSSDVRSRANPEETDDTTANDGLDAEASNEEDASSSTNDEDGASAPTGKADAGARDAGTP